MKLSTAQVLSRTGCSRATLYKYINTGKFPLPVKIFNKNFWFEFQIIQWEKQFNNKQWRQK